MTKTKKEKVFISKESQNIDDPEIERSMYYLGRALYQFSLMQANEKHKIMKKGVLKCNHNI